MTTDVIFTVTFALLVSTLKTAPVESEKNLPSETEIATCLTLMTVNDEWYWVSHELKEKLEAESVINSFEEKLRSAYYKSCEFFTYQWDDSSLQLINERINYVCKRDAGNNNPFLGGGLHCKQALAIE